MKAQTFSDDNFVYTVAPKKAVPSGKLNTLTKDEMSQNVTYFDGLGRPIQSMAIGQGGSGQDVITPMEYDGFGRQVKEYLPYAASNGGSNYSKIDPATAINTAINFYSTSKYDNTANPFSEKKLESSPLNRVLKQAAPGTSWKMGNGHEIKLSYQTNSDADAVKLYKATTTWQAAQGLYDISFSDDGTYAEKELYKNVTYDENTTASPTEASGSTVEFKNKEGQVVLKRTYESGVKHDTYYVYDTYGNLTYVLPPKATGAIDNDILNGLCYQYKYDYRNRLVEKKLPGKQWEFIVYDKLDRPVATGPAFSPFKNDTSEGWLITKYDAFGRPVYTGWSSQSSNAATRKSLQDARNTATTLFETKQTSGTIDGISLNYSNAIEPTSFILLTVNYYDDYAYPNAPSIPNTIEGQDVLANTKGLATGNWTRVVTTADETAGETTTTFYDTKARPISIQLQNHLSGYTITDSKLDFTGKAEYTFTQHKRTSGDNELILTEEFTYSPQDRLLTHTHQINGGVVQLLADNTYDDLGQLTVKNVGNTTANPLQKVHFTYNVRGWLTGINDITDLQHDSDPVDLFAFKINYNNQPGYSQVEALYNGNIAETFWKTGADNTERSYGYQYDDLNRLSAAIYAKNGAVTDMYNENLSYDKNGNIKFLNRNGDIDPQIGTNSIDALVYTYPVNSNQLSKVADNSNNSSGFNDFNKTGDDYSYDANGNMITDKNKNITGIAYNQLNLPKKITFGTNDTIEYIYNATGQKLEKIVTENGVVTTTNYLGGFQYSYTDNGGYVPDDPGDTDPPIDSTDPVPNTPAEANRVSGVHQALSLNTVSSVPTLQFFPTAEGYFDNVSQKYVFQYKDHLGNIRISYAKNPQTQVLEIIEENNYYPFGLKHKGYNSYLATNNKYKYQGQERQDELSLNWDSFKWRNYDYAIGRFMCIDPLAEKYTYNSTYAFQENKMGLGRELEGLEMVPTNPINFNSYVTHASNLFSNAVNYVKEHVVLQVEAKATIGVQAGVKTPFGSVGAGIITTDIGKVGVNTKGAYAKGGDGKGHNFAEANVKVLDKKLGVGGKVDYVNDTVLPNGNGNGSNGNTDLLQASSYQGKVEWEVNAGPGKSGPGFSDGVAGDISVPAVKYKATGGNKSDCTTCVETSFGAKAIIGVEVKVKAGFNK
nr:DUF6443 domain-containing protein [Flavobacterium sp. ASV13]